MAGVRGRSGGARKGAGRKKTVKITKADTVKERAAFAKGIMLELRSAKRRGEWREEVSKDPLIAATRFIVKVLMARAPSSDAAIIHLAERVWGRVKIDLGIEPSEGIQGIGFAFKYVDDPRVGGSPADATPHGPEETS